MPKKKDFMPGGDAEFQSWHDQHKRGAEEISATLGITAEDLAELAADNELVHDKIRIAMEASAAAKAANGEKDDALAKVKSHVRKLARRVRGHRDFTEALGLHLRIVAGEDSTDMKAAQPKLRGRALPHSQVEISFEKSRSEGVDIYGQREGDADWVFLGRDTFSPYLDERPPLVAGQPEIRHYKAVYVVKDKPVGRFSNEISVVTLP